MSTRAELVAELHALAACVSAVASLEMVRDGDMSTMKNTYRRMLAIADLLAPTNERPELEETPPTYAGGCLCTTSTPTHVWRCKWANGHGGDHLFVSEDNPNVYRCDATNAPGGVQCLLPHKHSGSHFF